MVESFDEASKVLERVSIKNPPFPVNIEVKKDGCISFLVIRLGVLDRDSGCEIDIHFSHQIQFPMEDEEFIMFVETRLKACWLHELSECFHVDNKRVHDPHPHEWQTGFSMGENDLRGLASSEISDHDKEAIEYR